MKGEKKKENIPTEFSHQHLDMYSHMLIEDLFIVIYYHLVSWLPIPMMKLSEMCIPS